MLANHVNGTRRANYANSNANPANYAIKANDVNYANGVHVYQSGDTKITSSCDAD